MITIIVIVFSLCCIAFSALVWNQYIIFRNEKVGQFRSRLLNMADNATWMAIRSGESEDDIKRAYGLYDKYSYNDMLYSFKPLTLEAWYTEEEIKILKGSDDTTAKI